MAERLGAMANPSPIQLAGLAFNRFFFITSFVPLGFVLIKLTNLEILKPALTDSIAPVLGLVWPVFPSQYEALRTLGSEQDASNYVLFFLCLFSLGALFLPSFVTDCVSNRKLIRNWSWREIIFALILLCISSGIVFLDTPKLNPKPIWNFYVDAFGLYYLRQYAIFMTVYLTILEPISKLFEEDNEAGKLDKAKEIVGVVLPANEDPALPLNPGEEALDEPASHVAA
jgi:hypothetical protein